MIDGYSFKQTGEVLQDLFTKLIAWFKGEPYEGTLTVTGDVIAGTHKLSEKVSDTQISSILNGETNVTLEGSKVTVELNDRFNKGYGRFDIPSATESKAGVMSAVDKAKLNNLDVVYLENYMTKDVDLQDELFDTSHIYMYHGEIAEVERSNVKYPSSLDFHIDFLVSGKIIHFRKRGKNSFDDDNFIPHWRYEGETEIYNSYAAHDANSYIPHFSRPLTAEDRSWIVGIDETAKSNISLIQSLARRVEALEEKNQKLVEDICKLLDEKYPVNYGGYWFYGTNGFDFIAGTKPGGGFDPGD